MAGGIASIIWCLSLLAVCWAEGFPITSLFPEVDFASKVAGVPASGGQSLPSLLSQLSYSTTNQIRKVLGSAMFYMYPSLPEGERERLQTVQVEWPQEEYK